MLKIKPSHYSDLDLELPKYRGIVATNNKIKQHKRWIFVSQEAIAKMLP